MTKKRNKKRKLTPFGRAVKKRLIDRGMSQRQLAEEIGADERYLDRILRGERSGAKYIHKIAAILVINIEKYIA